MGNDMTLFFTNPMQTIPVPKFVSQGGSAEIIRKLSSSIHSSLFAEERQNNMLGLVAVLVLLLHVLGGIWLFSPNETTITPAHPLMMEISMITISAPKPSLAPPPMPPQPIKKPQPVVKPQIKSVAKTVPPVLQKPADDAPAENQVEPAPDTQVATTDQTPAPSPTPAKATTPTESEQFTEANFRANYASNPKPEYPAIAKSRNWQGKVMLRVQVSAEGLSDSVKVEKSSGYEILDECAVDAVKKWRFVPAKRGETPVASSVLVPINFSLRD